MSYALFFHDIQISEVFPTKAGAWAFAEKCGHVTMVPARDEDSPRRILNLSHSIRQAAPSEEADAFFRDERLRTKLRSLKTGGVPLCDGLSVLRIRLANADERARHREKAATSANRDRAPVFLVDVERHKGDGQPAPVENPSPFGALSRNRLLRYDLACPWTGKEF